MSKQINFNAVFCDDIRHEINGKVMIVGAYSGIMFLPAFPYKLGRLCVFSQFFHEELKKIDGINSISVFKNGQIIVKSELDGLASQYSGDTAVPNEVIITAGIEMGEIEFEGPSELYVVSETTAGTLFGCRLSVRKQP